mmetsp:Transcript_42328/g.90930  ORF Transcript_42328/g.90930 Transcript_42328/m.90930 type:complete len:204 (+) Transcript_42328:336-947(+)
MNQSLSGFFSCPSRFRILPALLSRTRLAGGEELDVEVFHPCDLEAGAVQELSDFVGHHIAAGGEVRLPSDSELVCSFRLNTKLLLDINDFQLDPQLLQTSGPVRNTAPTLTSIIWAESEFSRHGTASSYLRLHTQRRLVLDPAVEPQPDTIGPISLSSIVEFQGNILQTPDGERGTCQVLGFLLKSPILHVPNGDGPCLIDNE